MLKRSALVGLITAAALLLTGCWSSHEVNTLGLAVSIGIDKAEEGYSISVQMLNPKAIASNVETHESPVVVYTSTGADIHETILRLTTIAPRKVYSSHLRMVILGEDVARDGISGIIDYFLRYHEYRTDFYFAIAKGSSAEQVLKILTPIEDVPGLSMYNKLKVSFEQWAPTKAVRIIELANDVMSEGIDPVINAVEIIGGDIPTDSTDVLKRSDNFQTLRFTELGAFQYDRLVGWLNETEAKGYNYLHGTVKNTGGLIERDGIVLSVDVLKADRTIETTVVDDKPAFSVTIKYKTVIVDVEGDFDVSKQENMPIINELCNQKIVSICEMAVKKAQEELKTDIFGFGERVHEKYPKYWQSVKDNWNAVFVDLPITIKAEGKLVAAGDIKKPINLN